MHSIKDMIHNELTIDKSVFITKLIPITDPQSVSTSLEAIKKEIPGANHYCYAYIIGDTGLYQKASDDGEPSKTAGFPMLEVLKKNDVTNILAVVVRFFGGIKLGAGGLIRAYSKSVSDALQLATITTMNTYQHITVTFDYHFFDIIKNILTNQSVSIQSEQFTDKVTLTLFLPVDRVSEIETALINSTSNSILIKKGEQKVIYL